MPVSQKPSSVHLSIASDGQSASLNVYFPSLSHLTLIGCTYQCVFPPMSLYESGAWMYALKLLRNLNANTAKSRSYAACAPCHCVNCARKSSKMDILALHLVYSSRI